MRGSEKFEETKSAKVASQAISLWAFRAPDDMTRFLVVPQSRARRPGLRESC